MRYGVQFGFNPLAILGLDKKGPGYDNPPIFVKGDSEDVEADELVHNDPFNFIHESGDEKMESSGSGKGNVEGGMDESPDRTIKEGKSGASNSKSETDEETKKGSGTQQSNESPAKNIRVSEQKDDVKASDIKKLELLYSEEGNTLDEGKTNIAKNIRIVELKNPTNKEGSNVKVDIYFYAVARGKLRLYHFKDVKTILRTNLDGEKVYEIAKSITYKFSGGIKVCLEQGNKYKNKK